ncbi:palladin isoform X3 [Ahaetulla prasina]|uniref:palladin isoform X3 n=1 Tax=Ahaetulla prasina TaxID=499056 RepID=UPI00264A3889|nr:palladin isoform X3 [Ahaetulla prasina]
MQDRSCEQPVPLSVIMKEPHPFEKSTYIGNYENNSEDSSCYGLFYDSLSDIQDGDFSHELSAFLSEDEINKSLELAHQSINSVEEEVKQEYSYFNTSPNSPENASSGQAKAHDSYPSKINCATSSTSLLPSSQTPIEQQDQNAYLQGKNGILDLTGKQASAFPLLPARPSFIRTLKNAERCSLNSQKMSPISKSVLTSNVPFKNKLCDKAATLIEELSAIFHEAAKMRVESPNGNSSSPDSGYLSPKSKQLALSNSLKNSVLETNLEITPKNEIPEVTRVKECVLQRKEDSQIGETVSQNEVAKESQNQLSPPQFIQKLRSQEILEGSKVLLQCRVAGNPVPQISWFCEGKELQNSPDIQICSESGGLQTLIIAEAFEDDTGRYCCLASNSLGSSSSSAELFVKGASSSDSDSEHFKTKSGAMPQAQKKSTSVSLTIGSSAPKSGITTAVIQPISVPNQQVQSPTLHLCKLDGSKPSHATPVFTKELQNSTANEGQVVVLECRVKGAPPLHVLWFRQGVEIHDSPDFRILQKKPRSTAEPEEICTLVIAETFPEDAGIFACTASNDYGSVTSAAKLTVLSGIQQFFASCESSSHDLSMRVQNKDNFQHFPPPPSCLEINSVELPPKHSENSKISHPSASVAAFELQLNSVEKKTNGIHPTHGVNGIINGNTKTDKSHPGELLSPTKTPPPVLAKPKLNKYQKNPSSQILGLEYLLNLNSHKEVNKKDPLRIQQLQNQIRLEKEADQWCHQKQASFLQNLPLSPTFLPPSSFQELESSHCPSPVQMSVLNSHSAPAMQTSSSFNYARPKQFIAAQNISPASSYVTQPSGSSTSNLPSPMSPAASQKQFGKTSALPFSQTFVPEEGYPWSPSPPPPPPPVFSPSSTFSVADSFPLPPPPPPLPASVPSPSHSFSPTSRLSSSSQSPSAFLCSMLPSQPPPLPVNALGLPKSATPSGFPKKSGRTARIASDEEIQGTKDAVIQDLERKLRFKEDLLNNGQPKLTYEEKMARRLLGADNAATVFNIQEPEEELAEQEYKVSSFEQRLISEIEFRLERTPVEESDDEVEHGKDVLDSSLTPYFETKLKHYKIFEGMPVTFICRVSGNPNPKIYWFKDGKQISKRNEHYRMQREPDGTCSLHTTASTLDDDGNYTVMAANPQGRISCTGRLMVQAVNQRGRSPGTPPSQPHIRRPRSRSRDSGDENEPIQERFFRPHFLQAPGDLIVQEGKLCRMDCKVSGLPTPDINWQLNGRVIRSDNFHKMLVRENGIHSLIIEPVTARDAGIYTCIATNRAGQNTFSLELIVTAKEAHKPPVFIEKLQNTGVAERFPVRLECRVSGVPPPQIFWKKENESLIYNTDRVSMHQDNHGYICLLIQGATKEDAGWYTASAKNEAGIVSCTARLDVYTQWQQQSQTAKPKKVRPSASRYAALSDQGLDIKAAFQPEANPGHLTLQSVLVESDDL